MGKTRERTFAVPKRLKSTAMTSNVINHASPAIALANKNPMQCEVVAIRKAMKATPVATG